MKKIVFLSIFMIFSSVMTNAQQQAAEEKFYIPAHCKYIKPKDVELRIIKGKCFDHFPEGPGIWTNINGKEVRYYDRSGYRFIECPAHLCSQEQELSLEEWYALLGKIYAYNEEISKDE